MEDPPNRWDFYIVFMDYRQIPSNSLGHALYRDTMFCIIDSLFVCRVSTFDRYSLLI